MDMEAFLKEFSQSRYDTVTVGTDGAEVYLRKAPGSLSQITGTIKPSSEPVPSALDSVDERKLIKATRVGLFYPRVKVGDTLEENFIIGQIRAMNIMHEVKAGKAGVVQKILISSGDAVEYGDLLLELEGQA